MYEYHQYADIHLQQDYLEILSSLVFLCSLNPKYYLYAEYLNQNHTLCHNPEKFYKKHHFQDYLTSISCLSFINDNWIF